MATTLISLPSEILYDVGTHLDSDSICQLRLVSRACKIGFGDSFLRFFRTQTIDLSTQGIQRLSRLASHQDLREAVRVVNLECLLYPRNRPRECPTCRVPACASCVEETELTPEPPSWSLQPGGPSAQTYVAALIVRRFQESRKEHQWAVQKQAEQAALSGTDLCEALTAALCRLPRIDTITLEAVAICYSGQRESPEERRSIGMLLREVWPQLWTQAIRAFRVVLSAIARSQTKVKAVTIFRKSPIVAIPTSELTADFLGHLRDGGIEKVGWGIRHLSISIGTPVMPFRPTSSSLGFFDLFDLEGGELLIDNDPRVERDANLVGFAGLLGFMPNLESLDLHLHNSGRDSVDDTHGHLYKALLPTIFNINPLPHLQRLALSGTSAAGRALAKVLSQHSQIQTLTLRNVFLSEGSWTSVLATVARDCPRLSRVDLHNLWQEDGRGVLHLESRCPMARKFDPEDADVEHCWYGPTATGQRFVWFSRVFTKQNIWELADVPSGPTKLAPRSVPRAVEADRWVHDVLCEVYHLKSLSPFLYERPV